MYGNTEFFICLKKNIYSDAFSLISYCPLFNPLSRLKVKITEVQASHSQLLKLASEEPDVNVSALIC